MPRNLFTRGLPKFAKTFDMTAIIKESLTRSHSYGEYRAIISQLLADGKATGAVQSDELTHYSLLNETRMNRLEKTIELKPEITQSLSGIKKKYTWLVISEGWCGDAAQIVPIIHLMAESAPKIDLRIVFRDENEELMNLFLSNGAKSIPKLIVIDDEHKVVAHWGPRPKGAAELILRKKAEFGAVTDQIKADLQLWYLHDKGHSTMQEITSIMVKADSNLVQ